MKHLTITLLTLLMSMGAWADDDLYPENPYAIPFGEDNFGRPMKDGICDLGLVDGYINDDQAERFVKDCENKWALTVAGLNYKGMNDALWRFCDEPGRGGVTYEVKWEGKEEKVLALFCFFRKKICKECEADVIPDPRY